MDTNNTQSYVYVSGALTAVENVNNLRKFYEDIGDICREFGFDVYIPHLYTDPEKHADIAPERVWETDKERVLSSSLIIAYIGAPSLGVGMELAYAEEHNKPVVLLYEAKKLNKVSRMARGLPQRVKRKEIGFKDYDEAIFQLEDFLKTWTTNTSEKPQSKIIGD